MDSTKRLYLGYGTFMIAFAVSRIFNYVANYYRDIGVFETDPAFLIPKRICYIVGLMSLAFLINGFERYFTEKTKGLFSLMPFIVALLSFFLPYEMVKYINYVSTPVAILVIVFVYIYMVRQSTGYLRSQAIRSLIGLFFFFLGIAFDSTLAREIFIDLDLTIIPHILGPILSLIGIMIFFRTINISIKKKKQISTLVNANV